MCASVGSVVRSAARNHRHLRGVGVRGVGVPDGVVCPQADPLGDGAVLLLSLCKLLLGAERLLGL